jgi:hypothetical protein
MIHINRPRGYYIGQICLRGERTWIEVTGRCTRDTYALSRAVKAMGPGCNRARALFVDTSNYYEPHVAMEARRV